MPTANSQLNRNGPAAPRGTTLLVWLAALTLAYALVGRASLLLAIPPGYATPVWPAAGIALAALLLGGLRLWPAVFTGSLLVNFDLHADWSSQASMLYSAVAPGGIAIGATLQALIGAVLIRRCIGSLDVLKMEWRVAQLLLIGGPLACLISAGCAAAWLGLTGTVQLDGLPYSALTWWVGDSIGVLIATPLTLLWLQRPARDQWPRKLLISIPLMALLMLSVCVFLVVSRLDQARVAHLFDSRATELQERVEMALESATNVLVPVEAYFESSREVTRQEFRDFTLPLLEKNRAVSALAFNELLAVADLPAFEAHIRAGEDPSFKVWTIDDRVDERAVVVRYIQPQALHQQATGLDVNSERRRRDALRNALASDRVVATRGLQLVQPVRPATSVLLFQRIDSGLQGRPYLSATDPRQPLGFAVAIFEIEQALDAALSSAARWDIRFQILDVTDPASPMVYAGSRDGADEPVGFEALHRFDWAGRNLQLRLYVSENHLLANRSWQAWGLLVGALLFTALLGVFLIMLMGRQSTIEDIVLDRTDELRGATGELERSNQRLQEFAYVVSHDLKAPLRTINGFIGIIRRRHEAELPDGARDFFGLIARAAGDMHEMIDGILTLSRVGRNGERELFAAQDSLARVRQNLHAEIAEKQADIQAGPLPRLYGVRLEFDLLLQNLVGNAVKFSGDEHCRVRLDADRQGSFWRFAVTDNGIGIPAELHSQLFKLFHRINTDDGRDGQGIGLAICERIVESHGGRIEVDSEPGRGTTFSFTWPAAPSDGVS